MKTKTGLFISALVVMITMSMMSCKGCQSNEKRQYIDSLISVAGSTDESYTIEQKLDAMQLLIKEEHSLQKEDIERMIEINFQMQKAIKEENDTDNLDVDTFDATARSGSESEGFGRCSRCNCKAFEGRGQTCGNCGHAYSYHY